MIQVSSKPPAEPVWRVMSDATMKMPEPIIEPTTIMVPSKRPMARTKPGWVAVVCAADGSEFVVVSAIRVVLRRRALCSGFAEQCRDIASRARRDRER